MVSIKYIIYPGLFLFVLLASIQQVVSLVIPTTILIAMFFTYLSTNNSISISRRELLLSYMILFIYLLMALPSVFYISNNIEYLQIRRVMFGVVSFMILIVMLSNCPRFKVILAKILETVIIIHAIILIIQLLLYYLFGLDFDVLQLIGRESNNELGIAESVFYRPSGFFLEPGTYANQSFLLFSALCLLKKPSWLLVALVALTYASTMSVFAFFFSILVVIYRYMISSKFNFIVLALIAACSLLLIYYFFGEYLEMRFLSRDDQSLSVKMEVVEYYKSWTVYKYFIGNGLANTGGFLVRDSSLIFNYLFTGGILGLITIVMYLFLFIQANYKYFIIFLGLFLSKVDYIYVSFWLMTAVLIFLYRTGNKDES